MIQQSFMNTLVAKNFTKDLFGGAPYCVRCSSIKLFCNQVELNRCTTTKSRWNKIEDARTSVVVSPSEMTYIVSSGALNSTHSPTIANPTRSRTEEYPCWLGGTPPQSGRIYPV